MFGLAVVMVVIGHSAARRWHVIADELSRSYEQGVVAERLRWGIAALADETLESAEGSLIVAQHDASPTEEIERTIVALRAGAGKSEDPALELDHVGGLEEAYRELDVIIAQIATAAANGDTQTHRARWAMRLREITDEVDDAAAAMEQYLRERNRHSLIRADKIRRLAVSMTGAAMVLIAGQFLVMTVLVRRWVTRPLAELEAAADTIGSGRLDFILPPRNEREWQKVADALHQMTRSLGTLQHKLRVSERLSAIGEVAAYTAHNVRNPIASIRAMAQVGLTDAAGNVTLESTLRDIIACVDKMERWIAGLLSFARPLEFKTSLVELNAVTSTVYDLIRSSVRAKNVGISYYPLTPSVSVRVDEPLVEQAVYAIVSNAIDAVTDGGRVDIRTGMTDGTSGQMAIIEVTDNGPGITPEMLPDVFKPFVTGKEGGSGLGLAQAKKIIDLHLGDIRIESQLGVGTTVTISLPLAGV